ncbi:MAG: thioredoxin [Sulfurimonas sp.]|nr:MAG: thioredoxin [Sulfurimonas sp.]
MKTILLLFLILASSLVAKVEWCDSFEIYDDAKASDKLVMVMLSRKDCPACHYMYSIVFEDKQVSKLLKDAYLAMKIDVDEDFIPLGLEYFATPTFYFLDKNEIILKRLNGGEHISEFIKILKELNKSKEED